MGKAIGYGGGRMAYLNQNELVIDITHDFIAQVAPDELSLFPGLSQKYRKNPEQFTGHEADKDQMLGFGLAEVILILTPIVMKIVTEALTYSNEKVVDSAVDAFLAKCWSAVRKLLRIAPRPKEVPNYTSEQLVQIRATIIRAAHSFKQLSIPEEQAQLLAEIAVGKLATAQSSRR
jgi:hypothetical protein